MKPNCQAHEKAFACHLPEAAFPGGGAVQLIGTPFHQPQAVDDSGQMGLGF